MPDDEDLGLEPARSIHERVQAADAIVRLGGKVCGRCLGPVTENVTHGECADAWWAELVALSYEAVRKFKAGLGLISVPKGFSLTVSRAREIEIAGLDPRGRRRMVRSDPMPTEASRLAARKTVSDRYKAAKERPAMAPRLLTIPESFVIYKCKLSDGTIVDLPLPPKLSPRDARRLGEVIALAADEEIPDALTVVLGEEKRPRGR